MEKLFPSDTSLLNYREVIAFAYGLTDHPDDVIDVIYDKAMAGTAEYAVKSPANHHNIRMSLLVGEDLLSSVRNYIAAERVETKTCFKAKTSIFVMRNRHVCVLNTMNDFVPSRNYILEYSDGNCAGIIYQDPAFDSHDLQGANRSDPTMYIIDTDESALNLSMAVMKKLSEYYDIRITRLYSKNVKEGYFVPPEGPLNLKISPSKRPVSWTIITQIKEKKMCIENSKESFSESAVVCFEQFADSVFLGSNMKSLEKSGYELPSHKIQFLARQFYRSDNPARPRSNDSRFTILDFNKLVAHISRDKTKYFMQLMSLTHLRELHISSYCLDANLDDLRLNCASLEELHLYSDVDWKSNEYLRIDTEIKDSQRPKTDSNRVRLTKCLQKLRLISVWGVLTDRIVDLLKLELAVLRIDLRHLYYTDMKTLTQIISLLAPHLKWLYFCGDILIGQLGNLFGGACNKNQPCIFQCLEQLALVFSASEISMGINALAHQVGCGKFPHLVSLGLAYRHCPNDEVETVILKLVRTCVDYYAPRPLFISIEHDKKYSFTKKFTETIKSLLGNARECHQRLATKRNKNIFVSATMYHNSPGKCHHTLPPRPEFATVHPGECYQRLPPRVERQISQFAIVHYKSPEECYQPLRPQIDREISQFAIVHYKS